MGKVKVRMLVSMAGPDDSYFPGQVYDVDAETAKAWCELPPESPRAEYVEKPKPKRREAAAREKREKAVQPAAEKR
jgi:hypothetical protein